MPLFQAPSLIGLKGPPQYPTIAGELFRFRADTSVTGDPVTSWAKISGSQSITLTSSGSNAPDLVTSDSDFNGEPVISWDGSNDYLQTAWSPGTLTPHFFIVYTQVTTGKFINRYRVKELAAYHLK